MLKALRACVLLNVHARRGIVTHTNKHMHHVFSKHADLSQLRTRMPFLMSFYILIKCISLYCMQIIKKIDTNANKSSKISFQKIWFGNLDCVSKSWISVSYIWLHAWMTSAAQYWFFCIFVFFLYFEYLNKIWSNSENKHFNILPLD